MTERLERPRSAAAATALVPPRLVVYESPGQDELLEELAHVYPAVAFEPRSGWEFAEELAEGVVPVWHWTGTIDDLASASNDLLRKFAYPLLADGQEFVISFSFARQELLPRALDPGCLEWLDVEDIGRLVTADAIETRFDDLRGLPTRIVQTPIEETARAGAARRWASRHVRRRSSIASASISSSSGMAVALGSKQTAASFTTPSVTRDETKCSLPVASTACSVSPEARSFETPRAARPRSSIILESSHEDRPQVTADVR